MKKILLIGIIIIFAILLISIFSINSDSSTSSENKKNTLTQTSQQENPNPTSEQSQTLTIKLTSSGFEPSTLTINSGDIVKFLAIDGSNRWPASDIHPTHTKYPGSNINKCFPEAEPNIFDSCGSVLEGSSFEFTFTEQGEWKYHDHLQPGKKGTIVVE
jgi:plastocyanin